jgi:hypothetical protein
VRACVCACACVCVSGSGTYLRHRASADFGEKESTLGKMQETSSTGGQGRLSFSWEIGTSEVKGWVTKIHFQRGRFTRE